MTAIKTTEIKPCPFCQGTDLTIDFEVGQDIKCNNCGWAKGLLGGKRTEAEVIEFWNKGKKV